MKLVISGIGSGNPDLITLEALNALNNSDLILIPRSNPDKIGVAENIINFHKPDANYCVINFPMILDSQKRDSQIKSQLENLRSHWENAKKIFFPVIGDSSLYSTGAYLHKIFLELVSDLELEMIPGISAHSVASSCAKKFLALGDEIFTIIPGIADSEKIKNILRYSDSVAIYKPTALNIDVINPSEWTEIIRVDYAGLQNEKIFYGENALKNINAYLSILLLKK